MSTSKEMIPTPAINNDFYNELGLKWYTAKDDPVALLRAESRLRNPWLIHQIELHFNGKKCDILDIGCGGGFLSNALAKAEHRVRAIDLSEESLAVAKSHDSTGTVRYEKMDARHLKFENESFDVVCAMDFLEHVSDPMQIFQEAARVLRKDGLFFFHTFNRNWISHLVVIKGVEWFVKNTPPHMHVYNLFIKPTEIKSICRETGFRLTALKGVQPRILSRAFWKMLISGVVADDFQFHFTSTPLTAYTGVAQKCEETLSL